MKKILNAAWLKLPIFVWVLMALVFFLMVWPIFTDQHLFYNLEPYPDSFTYIMPAWSVTSGQGFLMIYEGFTSRPNIISSYSVLLTLGFLVWHDPRVIILVNALAASSILVFVYLLFVELKLKQITIVMGEIVLAGHVTLWWISGLALSENLAVVGLLACLWSILRLFDRPNKKILLVCILTLVNLFLVRMSLIPVAAGLWGLVLMLQLKQRQWLNASWLMVSLLLTVGFFYWLQLWMGEKTLNVIRALSQTTPSTPYYGFQYVWPNLLFYGRGLLGATQTLLWMQTPVTTAIVSILALIGVGVSWQRSHLATTILVAGLALQFPTLLIFYHQDHRYILASLPLLVIFASLAFDFFYRRQQLKVVGITFVLSCGLLIWSQLPLIKLILVQNVLFRSTPWQYESVKEFNNFFADHEGTLITALPPYLIALFQDTRYQLLPLSPAQEYIAKQRYIWGSQVNYDDLLGGYESQLEQGESLFITNAYITHQQKVVTDFETYKQRFNLQLVKEGCLGACNIYQLSLRQE